MSEIVELRKKICLLGDPEVGKTSLIRKYVFNEFSNIYQSTIGTEVMTKDVAIDYKDDSVEVEHYELNLAIWDIIGQKEYHALITKFYKSAEGAMVVCDLTRDDTIENVKQWISSLFSAIGKIPIILVGNKYDLIDEKTFEPEELLELSSRYCAPWFVTSAKEGGRVEDAFFSLGQLIVKNFLFFEKMDSIIDVLDAIIVDFCEVNGGLELGMPLFREEFVNIPGANLKEPKKEVVEDLIDILTNVTRDNKGKETAKMQQSRFNGWLKKIE